jgi:hypothetical protein
VSENKRLRGVSYRSRLAGKSEQPQRQGSSPAKVRNSLFDPVVIAAILGILGGGVTVTVSGEDAQRRHEAELSTQKREGQCNRAFAFLQDEEANPKLELDDAFYQQQRRIADSCSAEGRKP